MLKPKYVRASAPEGAKFYAHQWSPGVNLPGVTELPGEDNALPTALFDGAVITSGDWIVTDEDGGRFVVPGADFVKFYTYKSGL